MSSTIKTENKTRRQDTFCVDPSDVRPGRNSRMIESSDYLERIVDRAISIAKDGQLQPVEVRKEADNTLTLSFGFTRYEAVKLLRSGFTGVDPQTGESVSFCDPKAQLWVKVTKCDVDEAFLRGIKENLERNDTTDLQEALAQSEIRTTMGWTDAAIARFYGYRNQNRVSFLSKLLSLPEKTQQLVHQGKMALHAALLTEGLSETDQTAVIEAATDGKGRVEGAALKGLIRDLLAKRAPAASADETTADAGTEDETEDEAEDTGHDEAPVSARLKRSVKEFANFVDEAKTTVGVKPDVLNLLACLVSWFKNEKTDKQLWNAIDKV
jgi:ParB-like chromosome segregation protein Spo0J